MTNKFYIVLSFPSRKVYGILLRRKSIVDIDSVHLLREVPCTFNLSSLKYSKKV
jgi:hypothetical protein